MTSSNLYHSPIGDIYIHAENDKVTRVEFIDDEYWNFSVNPGKLTDEVCNQLAEYFAGNRRTFDLPLQLEGTDFRKKVWEELCNIPYGEKVSYQDIAHKVNCENGWRAVGNANHYNPIVIIVPCHRVVKTDGSMGGYGGGIWRKEFLLRLEGLLK
ncbi:MAG: methylated-DNA--[protein]-cysteine S-methyltransferase [bacterium]